MIDKKILLEKIGSARDEMLAAEKDLEKVLRDIHIAPRAEKMTISKVVEDAFAKLKAARVGLGELERLVTSDGD